MKKKILKKIILLFSKIFLFLLNVSHIYAYIDIYLEKMYVFVE